MMELRSLLIGIRRHRKATGDQAANPRQICSHLYCSDLAEVTNACRYYARQGKLQSVSYVQQPYKPYIPVGYTEVGGQ